MSIPAVENQVQNVVTSEITTENNSIMPENTVITAAPIQAEQQVVPQPSELEMAMTNQNSMIVEENNQVSTTNENNIETNLQVELPVAGTPEINNVVQPVIQNTEVAQTPQVILPNENIQQPQPQNIVQPIPQPVQMPTTVSFNPEIAKLGEE